MSDKSVKAGVLFAIAAYGMWGFAPMYFKLMAQIPAAEILVHRIVWSVLVLVVLVLAAGHIAKVRDALRNKRVLQVLLVSGLLLAGNWWLFIWAVNNNHLLDASLGYYINPILNVFLGRIFLGEKLRRPQQFAVVLAIIGVSILVFSYGQVPWIALVLAGTFGVYGLLRKQVRVDSLPGLFIESCMMLPFAIAYWFVYASDASNMFSNDWSLNLILIGAGIVTTAPLLCFTAAARRIMYSTLGFFQYIGPSIMFVLAVFLYAEPLSDERLITFAFVWLALAIFSTDSLYAYRMNKRQSSNDR